MFNVADLTMLDGEVPDSIQTPTRPLREVSNLLNDFIGDVMDVHTVQT